ncbi:von Willebrand factor A domain-containing protein 5A [Callorhinus ursinus]|uniref:von Willebrand factor A domain-containing protein 5A n=1 Tax=Callorhinus ursinus TaxID=34884 RepID=A0A3Q7S7B1_CALUR|nr:von Willebrand factor A domain-containing protein 5A [Callorhinus ursinus]XP_025749604.1 von Willebrand factor A domain-containing protein 5A [Callorhinus ursinus]XP_025749606.1 von Willebrand factor A domain-containing protein 5A [Callorhinus ursinus]
MVLPGGLLTRKEEPVPLKSICVTLSIREFVAGVSATLNYENEEDVPLETFFVFPMDDDSAVYSFEAVVDGKKIKAELQEKRKAHSIYESAISNRRQAFLLEEDKYSRDVFCCNVGNLNPGSKVALTLKSVQELPLEADGALRYVLPAVLNPRYRGSGSFEDSCLDMKTPVVPLEDLPYTFSMLATISSQHGIERIQSNCPFSPTEYLGEDKTSAQVSLTDGHKFDRDVELLIYYSEVHTPTVAVEMGQPKDNPDGFMKDPSAMVCFYPNIPEAQSPVICGEFVFLMDRSGSMQCPISKQDKSQLRIEAAKETLLLLLKSLPIGCYFNVYGFGSSYEAFFPNSVQYTQQTMEEALRRVKLMQADLGGTEILTPLQIIYREPSIAGHPLQLFVFTDGEVTDTFNIINEVKRNRLRHRCFSFGIGEGASTSLIKGIARVAGGTSEFITGKDRMQSKALRALKRALQPAVEDISVSWDLPRGLSAKMLSPEQTVLYKGQRLIVYALLSGTMPPVEATGEVYLKYTLQGKNLENRVTFSLQPKPDDNFTIHRLAAKSFLRAKDMGFRDTPAKDKKDVLKISIDCGVISSQTAFIAVNKNLNKPVQGPLTRRDVPRPVLLGAASVMPQYLGCALPNAKSSYFSPASQPTRTSRYEGMPDQRDGCKPCRPMVSKDLCALVFGDNHLVQLISLQNADGSWYLDENLAGILGKSLEDLLAAVPVKDANSSSWATVLAVVWLHSNAKQMKGEWELLEKKARTWIHIHAASIVQELVKAAIVFTKSSVDPAIFGL